MRGPAEPEPGPAARLAAEQALSRVSSDDVDAAELAELVQRVRHPGSGPASEGVPDQSGEIRVWSVLTVDVADGLIQAVRVVRNPDKLGHL